MSKYHADYSTFKQGDNKDAFNQLLLSYKALAETQTNWVTNLANCSSLLWYCYHESFELPVNWCGFYLVDPTDANKLILGPFMGKVACQEIEIGKGVCGTAASRLETQLVKDVNKFPGHIACDGRTKSEIVIPLIQDGKLKGVLDMDCLRVNGFTEEDAKYLSQLCNSISETCIF